MLLVKDCHDLRVGELIKLHYDTRFYYAILLQNKKSCIILRPNTYWQHSIILSGDEVVRNS